MRAEGLKERPTAIITIAIIHILTGIIIYIHSADIQAIYTCQ